MAFVVRTASAAQVFGFALGPDRIFTVTGTPATGTAMLVTVVVIEWVVPTTLVSDAGLGEQADIDRLGPQSSENVSIPAGPRKFAVTTMV
jgi:hypothetical protein